MTEKFKIQGVGIDTSTINLSPWKEGEEIYDYIHTSISSNNDFLLKDYVKSQPGASLVTTIDFIDSPERAILGHVMELGRKKIDLLLVPGNVLIKRSSEIKDTIHGLKSSMLIEEFGISNPESINQIKDIETALGEEIKYVSLDICPLHFNYEIINYCNEHGIYILGFNPFGGYISAPGMISSFTMPYLLGFASTYSTVLFLSGRDIIGSIGCRGYIRENIIGKEVSPKFLLKKSVNKLYKPIKKVVNTSVNLRSDLILEYDIPEFMYPLDELTITLGKTGINVVPEFNKDNRTKTEESVYNILDITDFPEDGTINDIFAISRYQILSVLRTIYPEIDGWKLDSVSFGERISVIGVSRVTRKKRRGVFGKKEEEKETENFLFTVLDKDNIIFIQNYEGDNKNSSVKDSNSNI